MSFVLICSWARVLMKVLDCLNFLNDNANVLSVRELVKEREEKKEEKKRRKGKIKENKKEEETEKKGMEREK